MDQISWLDLIIFMSMTIVAPIPTKPIWQILPICILLMSQELIGQALYATTTFPPHDNMGEHLSQCAAEIFWAQLAPQMECIALFDTDKYLVPMGTLQI
jgi:hypothetical protein